MIKVRSQPLNNHPQVGIVVGTLKEELSLLSSAIEAKLRLRMENLINIRIELPQEVINKIESVIIETITKTIKQQVDNIKAEPKMYTRKEAATTLRVTLPTLRQYEIQGRLVSKRAGKRVLYLSMPSSILWLPFKLRREDQYELGKQNN